MTPALLVLAVTLTAPAPKEPPKKDSPLVGEWVVEGLVVDGEPKRLPAGTTWAFAADGTTVLRLRVGRAPDQGTFKTDSKKDPAEVDVELGPRTATRGIYRLDGDTLTLCLAQTGADRPKGFDAPAGSNAVLWTLKRAPKKRE